MQIINLDLSVKGIIPLLQAKQGDVGRKFQAVITDGGTAYEIPSGTNLSVWYSSTSGEGNYSAINKRSAFAISGNTVTVELVAQMLACAGGGTMCLVMNSADGTQIATWNIPYIVEKIPGANSEGATQYYTAFSEAVTDMSAAMKDYVLTPADKQEIAEMVDGATFVQAPTFVDSVDEMTDTGRVYVLNSTGHIWAYKSCGTIMQTVKEQIVATADNPWGSGRLGSSGTVSTQAGYVVTPYIDLSKYPVPFEIHLGGIQFMGQTYNTCSQYKTDKTHIQRHDTNATAFVTYWRNATLTDNGDGTCKISITAQPVNKSDVAVGYTRFTGYGTETAANVYVTYEAEASGGFAWMDTGIVYGGNSKEAIADIAEFCLANPVARAFLKTIDYDGNDYSYTQVADYTGPGYYRKDLPFPVVLVWGHTANAVQYAVTIGSQLYYTKDNTLSVYNLIPNTTYSYKVCALCADGSPVLVKSGSFKTTADKPRMLNIDGIQNVRDIGGYTGLNSKTVKYGLLYRGAAMDEAIAGPFRITDAGKHEMVSRVGIRTDVDLRYGYTESALGVGVDLVKTSSGYESYAEAITNATQRGNFKALLESIVTQLTNGKPAYIHCSGGCDRTGTFVFLLLGLLGVSESDLAKEYELSSLSAIGAGRYRNSTVYNYKGMVDAIKAYSGTTITERFVAFATDCGVTSSTITGFRNLMLE